MKNDAYFFPPVADPEWPLRFAKRCYQFVAFCGLKGERGRLSLRVAELVRSFE